MKLINIKINMFLKLLSSLLKIMKKLLILFLYFPNVLLLVIVINKNKTNNKLQFY